MDDQRIFFHQITFSGDFSSAIYIFYPPLPESSDFRKQEKTIVAVHP